MKEKSVQRLLVFLPPHRSLTATRSTLSASTVVSYVAISTESGGTTQAGETPITLLPKAANVDLVFDTSDVFVSAIDAPKLSEAKLRQALPNLLEDRLLADPADCHFAFSVPRGESTTTIATTPKLPVAVIDRGLLTRALDALSEAGFKARLAYDEIYTVPAPSAGVLSVRVDRGRGIARSGKHDGFAFDFEAVEPPAALLLAVRQLGIKRVQAYGRDAARFAQVAEKLGVAIDASAHMVDPDAADNGVNLLQGPFTPGGLLGSLSLPKLTSGALRAPLIWLGVAIATFIAGMNAYFLKLQSEDQALRSGMETSFRSAFPEATAIADAIRQTKQQLSALRSRVGIPSADDFSVLNTQVSQLMASAPVGSVAGVEYRDGVLRIKTKKGQAINPALQNSLRAQAIQQGLDLRFENDGSARLSPAGQ